MAPKRKVENAVAAEDPDHVKKRKLEAEAKIREERQAANKARREESMRKRMDEAMSEMDRECMEEHGMGWFEYHHKCSDEEQRIRALQSLRTDGYEAGSRKFELWCSISRWMKRNYPEVQGEEFFVDKPAKDRRVMMSRLIEYMTWRVTTSKEVDPVTGSTIINPKTGKPKAMSAFSVVVLAMEVDDLVQKENWLHWAEEAKVKRAFQDLAVDLIVDNNLDRSLHGVNEEPLSYYNRKELADFPDDQNFEAAAGREMRLLKARRLETQWTFMEGVIEARAADGSATVAETVEALKALEVKKKEKEEKQKEWDWPSDLSLAKKWDEIGDGCMAYWVPASRRFAGKIYYH